MSTMRPSHSRAAGQPSLSRRDVLFYGAASALGSLLCPASGSLWAVSEAEEPIEFTDYTRAFQAEAQASHPRVKCLDLRTLTDWQTPEAHFFTFHQTDTPDTAASDWRLRIGGWVAEPGEFSLQELKERGDARELGVTLECSGNSNQPQIMNGLVGNAVWRGVPLRSLLEACRLKPEAREVVFLALDQTREMKWQAGDIYYTAPYGRSLFVQDALNPDVLLAFEMNGHPLTPERGFPLRLIVPGWYGMAHVKWLSRIEVLDRRYEGQHMARNYHSLHALPSPGEEIWLDTSIGRNRLKSVVARVTRRPEGGGLRYTVWGAAWGGDSPIERVEVQVDGGAWRPARLDERRGPFSWILWSCDWPDAAPGPHTLVSRALDQEGRVQPTRAELKHTLASSREDNSQWPRTVVV